MTPRFPLLLGLVLLSCSCSETRRFPPDPSIPGTVQVDHIEGGAAFETYRTIDITPSAGVLRQASESPTAGRGKASSFSTGALDHCDDKPKAASRDGSYVARCSSTHTLEGIIDGIDIGVNRWDTNATVGSRTFDLGWYVAGFGWSPRSPQLAILVQSSFPQKGIIPAILGVFGHPPPDETVHLLIVSASTKAVRDLVLVEHASYGTPRLLGWDNTAE
jgi:hypothetical protein